MTIPDEFPIPQQMEILQALSGSQVLSALDALSGFHQMAMEDEDKEKTTFCLHRGLWQFKQMPFSLRNGPSIFQRVMQSILMPFLWTFSLVYIDDIVVYSKSYEEHLEHLDQVL
jgi:Reverse transcriptase (RNA-dependent DNA polymerase)